MSFKICMIGCGNMAFGNHGPACRRYAALHPDTQLAACCDLDESKAVAFKQEFGFSRHYTDIDLMLDTEKPHAVCMIVPVNLTKRLSCKILEKGYPLILEKPPGMNRDETLEMISAAKVKNTPNQIAFNRRYVPLIGKLKELLDNHRKIDGTMGIQYRMIRAGRKDLDFSTTAIHGIDVVKFLAASDYRKVNFEYQELDHVGKNVANIHMNCEFESGILARLDFLPVSGVNVERLEVNTVNGIYYLNIPIWKGAMDMPGKLLYIENNVIKLEFDGLSISGSEEGYILGGFYNENEAFFEDIRNGRRPAGDIASGLQSVELAECIRNRKNEYINSYR